MEFYSSKVPDHYRLIKILFTIVALALVVIIVLFFTLSIHLTAKASDGEIVADNAPIIFLAPYDADVKKVFVKEGDKVTEGDTLIILYNEQMSAGLLSNKKLLEEAKMNLDIYQKKMYNLNKQIDQQKDELAIFQNKLQNDKQWKQTEAINLQEQLAGLENKLKISKKRNENDYQLFLKGAISENEYNTQYQQFLDETNKLSMLKNEIFQQQNLNKNLDSDFEEKNSKYKLTVLSIEAEILENKKAYQQENQRISQLSESIKNAQNELNKLYIIAEVNGFSTNIFNTKNNVKTVSKNQALLTVSKIKEYKYYARFRIKEEEMKDIKIGQTVNIKVDAYNHYEFGIIKGIVSFIDKEVLSDTDPENQFYVLADLVNDYNSEIDLQSGLKVEGKIIIKRIRLYEYVIKSLFT